MIHFDKHICSTGVQPPSSFRFKGHLFHETPQPATVTTRMTLHDFFGCLQILKRCPFGGASKKSANSCSIWWPCRQDKETWHDLTMYLLIKQVYIMKLICVPFQALWFLRYLFFNPPSPQAQNNSPKRVPLPKQKNSPPGPSSSLILDIRTLSNRKSTNGVLRSWPRRRKRGLWRFDGQFDGLVVDRWFHRLGWDDWFLVSWFSYTPTQIRIKCKVFFVTTALIALYTYILPHVISCVCGSWRGFDASRNEGLDSLKRQKQLWVETNLVVTFQNIGYCKSFEITWVSIWHSFIKHLKLYPLFGWYICLI